MRNCRVKSVVVPGYYLVWYNALFLALKIGNVVVPGYYLVWYNCKFITERTPCSRSSRLLLGMVYFIFCGCYRIYVVVPGYYLVWYN